jgi:hypothetical protein
VPKKTVIALIIAGAAAVGTIVLMKSGIIGVTEDIGSADSEKMDSRLEKLRSVPYTARTAPSADSLLAGVVMHDPDRAYPGYNLYCSRTTPYAHLIDMDGRIVHSWTYATADTAIWEHAVMLENGDLVVIRKMASLVRLDWDSNVLWETPLQVHHEITPLPDGTLYTIAREVKEHRGLEVRFPSIIRVSAGGEVIERWSTYDHLKEIKKGFDQRSFLDTILDGLLAEGDSAILYENIHRQPGMFRLRATREYYDYLHLNTITRLPETRLGRIDAGFEPGNLLICFRNVNQIGILHRDSKEILWGWGEGELQWPHHPTMLENGNILVFDNGVERRFSRVIELEPLSERIVWEYAPAPPGSFYTSQRGSAQRLPNGNTLICDGNNGRAFEIDSDGEIVWEWFNPDVKNGRREQVYRVTRLFPDQVEPLLGRTIH